MSHNVSHELTKIEVSALRKANRIGFRHYNGVSQIECFKKLTDKEKQDSPFETERKIIINCDMRLNDYSENDKISADDNYKYHNNFRAFEMVYHYDDCFKTSASFIKEGDILTLNWQRNAMNNQILNEAGLHGDKLELIVYRGEKSFTFHINESISYNNSARMIQKIR